VWWAHAAWRCFSFLFLCLLARAEEGRSKVGVENKMEKKGSREQPSCSSLSFLNQFSPPLSLHSTPLFKEGAPRSFSSTPLPVEGSSRVSSLRVVARQRAERADALPLRLASAFFGNSRLGECSKRAALLVASTCFFPCLVNRRSMKTLARDSSAPSRKRAAQNYAVEAHHGRGGGDSRSGNAQTRPRIGVNGGGDLRGRAPFAPTLSHFRSVRGLLRAPCICPSLSRSRLSSRRLRLVRRVAIDLGQGTRV
jgi:hypothetical protein